MSVCKRERAADRESVRGREEGKRQKVNPLSPLALISRRTEPGASGPCSSHQLSRVTAGQSHRWGRG